MARNWVWLGAVACLVSACGGNAAPNTSNGVPSAGQAATPDESSGASNPKAGSSSPGGSGGSPLASAAGSGGSPGCAESLTDVSKALGPECPADLCAGAVAASDCAALPNGVLRASQTVCSNGGPSWEELPTLTFELSAARRKSCYYAEQDITGAPVLVGAEAWDDHPSFCGGTASHISVGIAPPTQCEHLYSTTLCDLEDPVNDPPRYPAGTPAPACFNGSSASCEPCCDYSNGEPDCTVEPEGYPGFSCTPPEAQGQISYCVCQCSSKVWSCAC
jgi:hypothetical protein